jgi:hypothetical protein
MGEVRSDSANSPEADETSSAEALLNGLLYGISVPERLVRSAVGLTAGTAKEIVAFVVPQAFQDSKSYEVAVRNSLGFLISGIGTLSEPKQDVPTDSPNQSGTAVTTAGSGTGAANPAEDTGRFIAKKAAGNFIDIAGLATLHVSPLWVLAIVSDVAYGTQTYLNELAQELQEQGLIDGTSTIHHVEDLFEAVKQASGTAASSFDQPPLSLEELRTSIEQTRQALNDVDPTQLIPEAEISRYWNEMRDIATREQVSLLGVSGAIAMQTVEGIRNLSHGTLTGLFVAGQIINRNIFGHYATALAGIHEQGIWTSVRNTYEPYVDVAWQNFTSSRKTWTEQVLAPSNFSRFWQAVKKWFSGKRNAENRDGIRS